MSTFKITNITSTRGKRQSFYNSTLEFTYVDQMERKTMNIKPDETIYFTSNTLPLSLSKLRIKGLVMVSKISDNELLKLQKVDSKPKEKAPVKKEKPVKAKRTAPKTKSTSKTSTRKTTPKAKKETPVEE